MELATDTLIALATTAAERWPLINALPGPDKARILESFRALRVRLHSVRVTSGDIPGRDLPGQTELPGLPPDTATQAGTLHRGEYRGVRVQATAKHVGPCPWARELWPLTSTGEIVPCDCGLTERLDGPIAAQVNGPLWAKWLDMARDAAKAEAEVQRRESLQGTREDRRALTKPKPLAWHLDRLRGMAEAWEEAEAQFWASYKALIKSRL